jgi:hypothetical protein|tara:strand:+ start:106 stop:492 length:387 start_codon:yes stop_codon:yes gene_type:complete
MNILTLLPNIQKVLDKFIVDKTLKAKLENEILTSLHDLDKAQIEINMKEAENPSLFVSGWRPFVGWTAAISIAYHTILKPILEVIFSALGYEIQFPNFDIEILYPILLGMLGLSASRSFEKSKGVARK